LLEACRLMLGLPRERREMPRRVSAEETAVGTPIAIDARVGRQRAQIRHGRETLATNRVRARAAVTRRERRERRLDAVRHLAAIASGAPAPIAAASNTKVAAPAFAVSRAADSPV